MADGGFVGLAGQNHIEAEFAEEPAKHRQKLPCYQSPGNSDSGRAVSLPYFSLREAGISEHFSVAVLDRSQSGAFSLSLLQIVAVAS